eukprot:SAG11_NODE_11989_length_727_cov_1.523885_2_plen_140_part_01
MSSRPAGMKKIDGGVDAPMSLVGIFDDSDGEFEQISETQALEIGGMKFEVEQLCYHSHNANKVWPGTFTLMDYIKLNSERYTPGRTRLLELGSATGAMAMAMVKLGFELTTSDVVDEGDEVAVLIKANFERNGLPCPPHV